MKSPADPGADAEEIVASPGVTGNEGAVHDRAAGGSLNGRDSARNVERQRRIILKHSAELEAVGANGAVEDQAMALVVVRAAVIQPYIPDIDRGAEEEFADI